MAALAAGSDSFPTPITVSRSHPFLQSMAATNRARHPSGSSEQRSSAFALAASPPQKNVGAAACPRGASHSRGCQYHWRQSFAGSRCRRSALLPIGDGDTASNSLKVADAPVRFPGLPCPVVTHAKQRVTSNGFRSFKMWKHARANLWASALMATTLFVLAFFRS